MRTYVSVPELSIGATDSAESCRQTQAGRKTNALLYWVVTAQCDDTNINDEYIKHDALGLAELVRTGAVSPLELVDAAIAQIEASNPAINAVVHQFYDRARADAANIDRSAVFAGVPFLLKDLSSGYSDTPLNHGSRSYRDFVSSENSELVRRYLAAGVIVLGKTNTPEFGLMPVTEPELFGPTRNPWDLSHTAGGSSGGAGAAVAARMVPAAHGGDGGGSIRIPSSCCGLFGLKPSRGRTPDSLSYKVWLDGVVEHVITRSVRDSAAFLDATALKAAHSRLPQPQSSFLAEVGKPPGRLSIAVVREPLLNATFDPVCLEGLEQSAKLCEELGHNVADETPSIDRQRFAIAFARMLCAEVAAEIDQAAKTMQSTVDRADFEAATWAMGVLGQTISAGTLVQAQRDIGQIAREFAEWTENYDVVLAPTLAKPPLPIGELLPKGMDAIALRVLGGIGAGRTLLKLGMLDSLAAEAFDFMPTTPLYNMTGQPAMSVPLYWCDSGLPIGLHFSAQLGEEALLLRLAGQLEAASPWAHRRPTT